jgi:hypothetical protein
VIAMKDEQHKIITIPLLEYNIKKKPNYLKLGKVVDRILEQKLVNGKYIIRAISSDDHKGLTLNQLTKLILKSGTDKYDSERKEVGYEDFCGFDHDFHGDVIEIKDGKLDISKTKHCSSIFGEVIYNFYKHAPLDRGHQVRINLILVYNFKKIIRAKAVNKKTKRRKTKWDKYLYKFKDPKNKKEALLKTIKITK